MLAAKPYSRLVACPQRHHVHLQGCLVRGIIDQVAMDDSGAITILEHKTRRTSSLPKDAQRRTARLQLLMYRFLFKRFGSMLQGVGTSYQIETEAG